MQPLWNSFFSAHSIRDFAPASTASPAALQFTGPFHTYNGRFHQATIPQLRRRSANINVARIETTIDPKHPKRFE